MVVSVCRLPLLFFRRHGSPLNGKRPLETNHMDGDHNQSWCQASKRPKTDINGYESSTKSDSTIPTNNLHNGQVLHDNHDTLNHLPEEHKRLTDSSATDVTQEVKSVSISSINGNGLADPANGDTLAGHDHKTNTDESEPELITLSDSEDELREVRNARERLILMWRGFIHRSGNVYVYFIGCRCYLKAGC